MLGCRALALVIVALASVAACVPPIPPVNQARAEGARSVAIADAALPVVVWQVAAPRVVVVAVHGLKGTAAVFGPPAERWARRGIATYAASFDYPEARPDALRAMIAGVAARHPGVPLVVVGESLGASLVVSVLAGDDPPSLAAAVLSAPAVWPDSASAAAARTGLRWLGTVAGSPSANFWGSVVGLMDATREHAAAVRVRPVLLLTGDRDRVVPRRGVEILAQRMGRGVEIRHFPDGGHTLFRDPAGDAVSDQVADWMLAQAASSAAATTASVAAPRQATAN